MVAGPAAAEVHLPPQARTATVKGYAWQSPGAKASATTLAPTGEESGPQTLFNMSMNVILYVPQYPEAEAWVCPQKYELDSWTFVLEDLRKIAHPCLKSVTAAWITMAPEKRSTGDLKSCDIEWVRAGDLKKVKLFAEDCDPSRQVQGRMAQAAIATLPDDWPIVFYYA